MMQKTAKFTFILAASFAFSLIARAQDVPPAQRPDERPQQDKQSNKTDQDQPVDEKTPLIPAAVTGPVDTDIHPAGRAAPWLGSSSPLHWGNFSIGNFTYQQVSDHFQPIGSVPSENIALSIIRTSIVFDRFLGKQRIVLQYEPQLAVLNGKLAGNAGLDNDLVLGTTIPLTPRLSLVVRDVFADVHSRRLYPPNFLAVDQQAGNLIQNNFLQNAGSYLTNTITGVVTYMIGPRTTFTVSPAYKYVHATNDQDVLFIANGHDISGTVALTYALTERQSIGGVYTLEVLRQKDAGGKFGNSYFHTAGFYYANQISRTWWLRGQLGVNLARYPDNIPQADTLAGTLTIVKTFTYSIFALGYSRGRTVDNFITARTGDLIQASYAQHLTKRLTWNNGAGYYRQTGADPRDMGNLLTTGLDFEIHPNVFVFGNYNHTFQRSSTLQLLSGTRNTFVAGLKWEPQPLKMH